jgi:hypothetical protein
VSPAEQSYDEATRQAQRYGGTVTFDTVTGRYRRVVPPGVRTHLSRSSATPASRRARLAELERQVYSDALTAWGTGVDELYRRSLASQMEPVMMPSPSRRARLQQLDAELVRDKRPKTVRLA